jgi:hypothetical protein
MGFIPKHVWCDVARIKWQTRNDAKAAWLWFEHFGPTRRVGGNSSHNRGVRICEVHAHKKGKNIQTDVNHVEGVTFGDFMEQGEAICLANEGKGKMVSTKPEMGSLWPTSWMISMRLISFMPVSVVLSWRGWFRKVRDTKVM